MWQVPDAFLLNIAEVSATLTGMFLVGVFFHGETGFRRAGPAIRFLDYVLEKLPFKVEVIQTDHGAEFGSRFHYHVLDRGSATSTSSRPRRG